VPSDFVAFAPLGRFQPFAAAAFSCRLPVPSADTGVGSSEIAIGSVRPNPLPLRPFAFSRSLRANIISGFGTSVNSALGVGNSGDEDAIAPVRGAEGGSRKAIPLRVVPERGQRSDHFSEALSIVESKEVCDVLHNDVAGSKVANDSMHLSPKRSLGMSESLALAGPRDSLAGEPAGDDVDSGSVRPNCSDVGIDADAKASLEELASEGDDLAEPPMLEPGEVESVGQESAAVKESSNRHTCSEVGYGASSANGSK
jgi:hypothetical protein